MGMLESYFRRCLEARYIHAERGADYAVERDGDRLFLLFEKSHGVEDWLNNLSFQAVPYRGMTPEWKCHAGFLWVWEGVKKEIAGRTVGALQTGAREITVIGYSHGAALAVFCHEWIWYHFPELRKGLRGYGFGCPRVICGCLPPKIGVRWEHFRVIRNRDDIVTHLPPAALGYCHVGTLTEIGTAGKYSGVDAHRPENYLAELHGY